MTRSDEALDIDVAAARRAVKTYVDGGSAEGIIGDFRNDGLRLLIASVGNAPEYGTVTILDDGLVQDLLADMGAQDPASSGRARISLAA